MQNGKTVKKDTLLSASTELAQRGHCTSAHFGVPCPPLGTKIRTPSRVSVHCKTVIANRICPEAHGYFCIQPLSLVQHNIQTAGMAFTAVCFMAGERFN